jgi:hypothetical protein
VKDVRDMTPREWAEHQYEVNPPSWSEEDWQRLASRFRLRLVTPSAAPVGSDRTYETPCSLTA